MMHLSHLCRIIYLVRARQAENVQKTPCITVLLGSSGYLSHTGATLPCMLQDLTRRCTSPSRSPAMA